MHHVSSAGAIGAMQVLPSTAGLDGATTSVAPLHPRRLRDNAVTGVTLLRVLADEHPLAAAPGRRLLPGPRRRPRPRALRGDPGVRRQRAGDQAPAGAGPAARLSRPGRRPWTIGGRRAGHATPGRAGTRRVLRTIGRRIPSPSGAQEGRGAVRSARPLRRRDGVRRPHDRAAARRSLPDRPPHRPRRHGQRLRSHRHPARPHRRGQGDAPRARRRRRVRRAVRARGAGRRAALPPPRRRRLRPGLRRRHRLPGDGVVAGPHPARRDPQGEPDAAGAGARAGRAGALGARLRPPGGPGPPRHQARERADRRRARAGPRPGQGRRLRAGQGGQRRHPAHRHRRGADRHRLLPRPRAGRRRAVRRPRRRLRRRRRPLRAAHRRASRTRASPRSRSPTSTSTTTSRRRRRSSPGIPATSTRWSPAPPPATGASGRPTPPCCSTRCTASSRRCATRWSTTTSWSTDLLPRSGRPSPDTEAGAVRPRRARHRCLAPADAVAGVGSGTGRWTRGPPTAAPPASNGCGRSRRARLPATGPARGPAAPLAPRPAAAVPRAAARRRARCRRLVVRLGALHADPERARAARGRGRRAAGVGRARRRDRRHGVLRDGACRAG